MEGERDNFDKRGPEEDRQHVIPELEREVEIGE